MGFDHLIISTSTEASANYWRKRLKHLSCHLHVVVEATPAGNGLGTLLALQQADIRDPDAAIALIHTAGKGTRLAPLPASEVNNKAAVKLPGLVDLDGTPTPITLLEAVIRQIAPLAAHRRGRLSVFWGDQLFLPKSLPAPRYPIEIFSRPLPSLSAQLWQKLQLHHYGLLYLAEDGTAQQYDKASYSTIKPLLESGALNAHRAAISLGSFSLTLPLARQLLQALPRDIKLDADPHLWMPFSLDPTTYAAAHPAHVSHYSQLQPLRQPIGATSIGDAPWLDFGRLSTYVASCQTLLTPQGQLLRDLLEIQLTGDNIIVGSDLSACRATQSILVGVTAEQVEAHNSIIIDAHAPSIAAQNALLYHATSSDPIILASEEVRADVYVEDQHLPIHTKLTRDSGADWQTCLPNNPVCFKDLYALNMNQDPQRVEEQIKTLRSR